MLIEAFARMVLTPSGLGGRRRKDGKSLLVARLARVGDGGIAVCYREVDIAEQYTKRECIEVRRRGVSMDRAGDVRLI